MLVIYQIVGFLGSRYKGAENRPSLPSKSLRFVACPLPHPAGLKRRPATPGFFIAPTCTNNMEYKRQFMEWERQMARQFADGKKEGIAEGTQLKAVDAAILLIKKYKETPENAAKEMNAPLELVLERLNN